MKKTYALFIFIWIIMTAGHLSAEDNTKLSSMDKIFIQKIRLNGNTVFSNKELSPLIKDYENKEVSAEELQELREALTQYYIVNGYVNSGAVIPDQEIKDGVVVLDIIEGRLTNFTVSGNSWLKKRYISSRVEDSIDIKKPLNVKQLQEHLQLLKQDPLIDNINADLIPGFKLGESILNINVKEVRPYNMGMAFNNYKAPGIGAYQGELFLSHINLTGWGDALTMRYAITRGMDDYSADYTIPLHRKNTRFSIGIDRAKSVVVTQPFDFLDIESSAKTYSIKIWHPFYKNLSREFAMGLCFEKRESETSLLGQGFAFSKGVEPDGKSQISVLRFSQEWTDRSFTQVIAARSTFNIGLDIGGATINERGPDGEFFFWFGQFQWLRKLPFMDSQLVMKTDLRLSNDPLLPMEKFEIGGYASVRGYREQQLTSDNGITGSAELRLALTELKIPYLSEKAGEGLIQLCPFFDFGHAWNTDAPDPEENTIYSSGLGLKWFINKRINADVYWGQALKNISRSSDYDLQDDGFHFQISATLF
ncbi:hemolysin activator HlyB C-terminal domain-containing [Desulfonema limicola]|uniref:Hemolysin activator HlyB C-terminal domain-containing n=1 Tax=Desulfonema limicola TaxID=45656 RepID=A0A975GJK8_9BACT|nr:ShlB/FhaC/HecB family hemolysin secretion/activation protein [Desulfonema limicola]QTA83624.1 hemolysin activator HlyB C-terminal domain-containing [Desulfonema limicola]